LAKRISEKEKIIIVKEFTQGKALDQLAKEFNCARSTIVRNLKKHLGEDLYKKITPKAQKINKVIEFKNINDTYVDPNIFDEKNSNNSDLIKNEDDLSPISQFTEITPLNFDIDNTLQKDLSSIPISEVNLPNNVYMIVDKKIELEIKYLRDYPDWQFLSKEELDRKTIEIFFDLKLAKKICTREQKVIKVPNPNVFRIVAPLLLNKGISRIVSADKLIAL
tara:strand:+ start:1086 stop:1748 length:663 start_codon:yes stop_codon:yes gene_type:complete